MGVKHINFIGGEPTLWPDLSQAIEMCRQRNIVTGLITNGLRFSDDEYWEEYQKMPCDRISLSVKSMNETEFSNATGNRNFRNAVKGIVDDTYMINFSQLSKDIMEMYLFLDELYDGNVELDIQMPLCVFPESFVEKAILK